MFISNKASEKLGWAVAAAMSIHNLTEGFMIALPLYLALKSRTAAFGWAALLGGLSQPIGALLGLLLMRNIDSDKENLMFGITFAVVSGMMTLITIQVNYFSFDSLSLSLSIYMYVCMYVCMYVSKLTMIFTLLVCRVCSLKPLKQIPTIDTFFHFSF